MTTSHYTSLELSRWLAKRAPDYLETEYYWSEGDELVDFNDLYAIATRNFKKDTGAWNDFWAKQIPAFNLLWDICVRYAKEFFGDEVIRAEDGEFAGLVTGDTLSYHTRGVLQYLQEGDANGAEDYIREHCVFNPKNKQHA